MWALDENAIYISGPPMRGYVRLFQSRKPFYIWSARSHPSGPDSPAMDVAQNVASWLKNKDVGGNPPDADFISAKPLSVRPPSSFTTGSSQAHTTSTSQIAEPVQAGANAGESSDIPSIIRDSLPVEFSDEDLANFRQYFSILSFVDMRFPLEGEQNPYPVGPAFPFAPSWMSY
ncbi:hypothetical protein LIER_32946 [Lithospermum erythrorhizon]|uniref:Uncharacterized protein n=1 Tax=Lithospermum erythrorhizon TaxID=34254 RepID=A0AAV3RVD0_LITER